MSSRDEAQEHATRTGSPSGAPNQTKAFPASSSPGVVIVAMVLYTVAGCTAGTKGGASSVVCGSQWTKGRAVSVSLVQVDGEYCSRSNIQLTPGSHTISVAVTWSNGRTDRTELRFEVLAEKAYWVLAYELEPGEPREQADIRMFNFGESLVQGALEGAVEGSAALWFPVVAAYSGVKMMSGHESPKDRPGDGCCFVWIQERESEAVIAGERP